MIVRGVPPLKVVKVQAFRANRSKTLHFGVASDGWKTIFGRCGNPHSTNYLISNVFLSSLLVK